MNPGTSQSHRSANGVAFLAGAILVLGAWAAGFFMGGGTGAEEPDADRSDTIAPQPAEKNETATGADTSPGHTQTGIADERRSRVLASLQAAMRQANPLLQFQSLPAAISRIGPEDIRAAVEFAMRQAMSSSQGGYVVIPLLMARWAEFDPRGAAEFALTGFAMDTRSGERQGALAAAVSEWVRKDPAAAKAWALALPGDKDRMVASFVLALGLTDVEPISALAYIRSLPADQTREISFHFFEVWSRRDPVLASQQALALPVGAEKDATLAAVAAVWAQKEPRAAIKWLEKSAAEPGREGEAVFSGAAHAAQSWAFREPQAALEWINSRPEGRQKTVFLVGAIDGLAHHDPAQAAELLESLPRAEKWNATVHVAWKWTEQDLAAATQWAEQVTDPAVRAPALEIVVRAVARSDVTQATAMLEKLPDGRLRDDVVRSFINEIEQADPDAAATWASTIGNAETRKSALTGIYMLLRATDEAVAKRWLENTAALSPKKKKEMLGK